MENILNAIVVIDSSHCTYNCGKSLLHNILHLSYLHSLTSTKWVKVIHTSYVPCRSYEINHYIPYVDLMVVLCFPYLFIPYDFSLIIFITHFLPLKGDPSLLKNL